MAEADSAPPADEAKPAEPPSDKPETNGHAEGAAPADADAEETPPPPPPSVDLSEYKVKIDHFEQMHVLEAGPQVKGAPNFRRVKGFPVFGTGQPTEEAIQQTLAQIPQGRPEKQRKVFWFNMRQEPVVYVNGVPHAPRHPARMHENMELEFPLPDLQTLESEFLELLQKRVDESKEKGLEVHKDAGYAENPMEREDVQENVKASSLKTFTQLLGDMRQHCPTLGFTRVPVVEENAPHEECFDILVDFLKKEPASAQCVFSCQMGRGRTTLGMVVACLIKEIQVSTELRNLSEQGLVNADTSENLIKKKFNSPLPTCPDDNDQFVKGEFDVIKELLEKEPSASVAKEKIDRIINLCGPQPKGTGLQNLRECIIETKWKYDVAPEERQVVWKRMILNYMERYFYLICFATYALEVGPAGFESSFCSWMNRRSHLRVMIQEGKDKLEWYRQVDPAKLSTLKDLINAPDYKQNLGVLIKTIYAYAFATYSDLPRGPIKNNSMRKLAAKTLLEILPPELSENVQKKLDEHCATPDFVTLIGLVSFHGQEQGAKL